MITKKNKWYKENSLYEVKYIPEENEHCWQTPKAEEIHIHNNINKLDVLKRNFLGCNIEKLKRCGKVSAQDGVKMPSPSTVSTNTTHILLTLRVM